MMIVVLALMLQSQAPAAQQPAAPPPPPVSIERIRKGLDRPALPLTRPPHLPAEPVFRVEVRERPFRFAPLWENESMVPSYVHPRQPLEHHEFLRMVTPEEFRSGTLYPCCVDLAPLFEDAGDELRRAITTGRKRGFQISVQPSR